MSNYVLLMILNKKSDYKNSKLRNYRRNYRLGHYAEILAAVILFVKGYHILRRRYKSPVGEIDLIARKGACLVFVEVKARQDEISGLYSVSDKAKSRIARAAEHFMMRSPQNISWYNLDKKALDEIRFDVMIVMPWRIRHIKNAWMV